MARERERHHQRNSRSAAAGSGFRRCVRAASFSGRRYGLTSWGSRSSQFRSGLSRASARRIEAVAGTDCRAVVGCAAAGKTGRGLAGFGLAAADMAAQNADANAGAAGGRTPASAARCPGAAAGRPGATAGARPRAAKARHADGCPQSDAGAREQLGGATPRNIPGYSQAGRGRSKGERVVPSVGRQAGADAAVARLRGHEIATSRRQGLPRADGVARAAAIPANRRDCSIGECRGAACASDDGRKTDFGAG